MRAVTWMNARYAGQCSGCRESIFKGQQIGYTARRTLCVQCARRIQARDATDTERIKGAEHAAHKTRPEDND